MIDPISILILLSIYHNDTTTFLSEPNSPILQAVPYLDNNNLILNTNPYGHNDTKVFTTAISYLQQGGKLTLGQCCYYINNTQLNIPLSVTIEGTNWDSNPNSKISGTNIFFDNYSGVTLNSYDVLKNVDLNFVNKNLATNNVLLTGIKGYLENVYLLGADKPIVPAGLRMIGVPTAPVADWELDHVTVQHFLWGFKCVSCSQNYVPDLQIQNYNMGMFFTQSDNNDFIHVLLNNVPSTGKIDVQFGDTATDGVGDNIFQFLTVQAGDTNFVSNVVFNSTNPKDIRPNHIYMLGIDGCVNTIYNNHSQGQIDIEHTSYPACNGK